MGRIGCFDSRTSRRIYTSTPTDVRFITTQTRHVTYTKNIDAWVLLLVRSDVTIGGWTFDVLELP